MTEPSSENRLRETSVPAPRRLLWPEVARMRPGMYMGSVDALGLLRLVCALVDNSVDEFLQGAATRIDIVIDSMGAVMVGDNGRGIPVGFHPQARKSFLEWVLTTPLVQRTLHPNHVRVTSLGPSIGIATVNAFSEWMRVEVRRKGKIYTQRYHRGRPASDLEIIGDDPTGRGTAIYFKIDPLIFGSLAHDAELLGAHLQDLCYLVPGLQIHFTDERPGKERSTMFYSTGGIAAWVRQLNRYTYNHLPSQPLYVAAVRDNVSIEVALQYNGSQQILTFVNMDRTSQGGTHLRGFLRGLTSAFNRYGRLNGLFEEGEADLNATDVRKGLCAIVSVRLLDPAYGGNMRSLFTSRRVDHLVEQIVSPAWYTFLKAHPKEASDQIRYRAITSRRNRTRP